ncbi:MAG TPA: hypothetical protein V6D23_09980 [Candidatus Obscuribacterales bacterium]
MSEQENDPDQTAAGDAEPGAALRFRCGYNVHWPPLLPLAARSQLVVPPALREGFRLNPRFHCQESVADAADWAERMALIGYSQDLPVCWVPHPLFGYPEAYWPEPELMTLIQQLAQGHRSVQDLDEECFELLSAGHLLVLDDESYSEQMHALNHHWRSRLAHEHYLHIPNLISPLQVAALRAYTRQRRVLGPLQHEDDAYTRRSYRFNDPVIKFWHQHLLGVLKGLAPEPVRSSYSVISFYEDTALAPHTDREPCIWNISIQLDTEPVAAEAVPWPLFLATRHGDTPILLQAGDALIYRGREMRHWREPLPPGRQETVLLFHFVDEAYEGQLW